MDLTEYFNPSVVTWVVTPLLIFLARVLDVTLGTIRILFLSRGSRSIAPILGFLEILIWLIAIRQVFAHLDNWAAFIAYAGGFAIGNVLGMYIEEKLAIGLVSVRVIATKDASSLIETLRQNNFGVTSFAAEGGTGGGVRLIFCVIRRKQLDEILAIVREVQPRAFVSVADVRAAEEGFFPSSSYRIGGRRFPGFLRKAK